MDTRDCSLKVDTRSCPLQEDTRSCNTCIVSNPFGGCILYGNDPACEIAKAAQNVIYKANKDACEAAKAAQNVIYAGDKAACESAKATQNAIYKAEKDACEVAKAGEKLACEAQKTIDLNVCRLNNVHSGDFVGPATENLFSRALGEGLWHSLGEEELLANALLRVGLASRNRDDTGDDLNLIVMMLMSELRSPTDTSRAAIASYASLRPYSFGSYLGTYRSIYGQDATAMDVRIADGIRSGWRPDAPAVNGAVRWYHRIETGGLPGLADLYEPIIDRFIYGDVTATFSTQPPSNLPPTVDAVSPAVGSVEGGTKLVVTGRNLRTGTTVLVGGVVAEDVVGLNSSTLTAMTPPHESGIVDVSVTVPWPGGGTASLLSAFTYSADENGIPTPTVNPNIADILFRNTQTGDVAGWLMNGLALSQGGIIYSGLPLAWRIEGVGDLNGDGKSDIVFRNTQTGDVAAWLMDGLTLSQGVIVYSGLPLMWDIQAVGDLNADGKADLVFRNTQTGDVAGWLMDGVRLAQGAVIYSGLPAAWQIATSGDLNGDGKLDLVFRNTQTHDVAGWLMNGLALAQGAIIYSNLPTAWQIATAGDLDGDRKADLVFRNTQSGDVAGWLMSGLALTQGEVIYVGLPAAWHIMGMGDLDRDGRGDLVFRQAQTGDVAGWTMNGLALTQGVIFYSGLPVAWQFEGIGDLDKR